MLEDTLKRTRVLGKKVKHGLRDVYWKWYGLRLRNPALPPTVTAVLFVCKGNICRSPFAEHLASKIGASRNLRGLVFGSAGLHVPTSKASPDAAIQVAKRFGVNLEEHASRPISDEMIDVFDMVVAMEAWQYRELSALYQRHQEKLFLLPLFEVDDAAPARGYTAFNIEDPYGGPPDRFVACFERIERCLNRFFKLIKV